VTESKRVTYKFTVFLDSYLRCTLYALLLFRVYITLRETGTRQRHVLFRRILGATKTLGRAFSTNGTELRLNIPRAILLILNSQATGWANLEAGRRLRIRAVNQRDISPEKAGFGGPYRTRRIASHRAASFTSGPRNLYFH